MKLSTNKVTIIANTIVAIIYLQTLFFKFSSHPDSVYIFTKLGLEPFGRYAIGLVELVCAILLLLPKTSFYATIASLLVISGAIVSHLGPLGIVVAGDGGKVFGLALIIFSLNLFTLVLNKNKFQYFKSIFG
ncbi:DoxX family protein [uncultured Cyclobacterium sp.]|uniref:DoxX family protein n=1 Tax=uncultured Cyclobacterium sp. TaxID=453820 RepID=UPI0030EB5B6D|tara:strand:- start:17469 stop:17864 length:396 start_codon:yes stop_codon:yes gene_type:complete